MPVKMAGALYKRAPFLANWLPTRCIDDVIICIDDVIMMSHCDLCFCVFNVVCFSHCFAIKSGFIFFLLSFKCNPNLFNVWYHFNS